MSNEAKEHSEPISTSPEPLCLVESNQAECKNSRVTVAGCSNQGNDSLPVKFVTDAQNDVGQYSVTNHLQNQPQFPLNEPGSSRCFLPLEQPFHKPQIRIVPTQTYAVDSPEAKLPKKQQSQQQMFSTRKAEMISSPNGRSAAEASATCTSSVSHGTGNADGTAGDRQEGCSRVSPVDLHGISPDHG